jgi:hypothetical protein
MGEVPGSISGCFLQLHNVSESLEGRKMSRTAISARPPRYIIRIVELLTPRAYRTALLIRLLTNYTTFPNFCVDAAQGIGKATARQSKEAFKAIHLFGDLACVYIAFSPSPLGPSIAVLALAAATLIWRDGLRYPDATSLEDVMHDGLFLAGFILVSQLLFALAAKSWFVSWRDLGMGIPIAVAMVTGWRVVYSMEEPSHEPTMEYYKNAWQLNLLWSIGVMTLIIANTWIPLPRRALYMPLIIWPPMLLGTLALRAQSDAIGGMLAKSQQGGIFEKAKKYDLARKIRTLFQPPQAPYGAPWSARFEAMFFTALASPMIAVLVAVAFGWIPLSGVNWMQWFANTAVFVTLWKVWIEIKKINAKVALALKDEIERLRKEEAS